MSHSASDRGREGPTESTSEPPPVGFGPFFLPLDPSGSFYSPFAAMACKALRLVVFPFLRPQRLHDPLMHGYTLVSPLAEFSLWPTMCGCKHWHGSSLNRRVDATAASRFQAATQLGTFCVRLRSLMLIRCAIQSSACVPSLCMLGSALAITPEKVDLNCNLVHCLSMTVRGHLHRGCAPSALTVLFNVLRFQKAQKKNPTSFRQRVDL
ncbi:hypothetical protein BCV70DRAFT_48383 [Testicularia cyperi]|uniref:Uncharacterized protein n=1 Tax=Testicularia cyperi TaxID=1882483 RepID=A0A317XJC6_9BASI|nr:hypothetical protein BCV70DRAFT_48383 [Testicularia cyperi]